MTTREEQLGLAGRCEAATGADRELDALIIQAIHFGSEWRPYRDGARALWLFGTDGKVIHYGGKRDVPAYTASIDAAETLVPDDCLALVRDLWNPDGKTKSGYASLHRYAGGMWQADHNGDASTKALALCAAALRARVAQIGAGS